MMAALERPTAGQGRRFRGDNWRSDRELQRVGRAARAAAPEFSRPTGSGHDDAEFVRCSTSDG